MFLTATEALFGRGGSTNAFTDELTGILVFVALGASDHSFETIFMVLYT